MVFDEPHSERTSTSIKIPEEPPFPEVEAPESDLVTPPTYQQNASPSEDQDSQGFRILEGDAPVTESVAGNNSKAEKFFYNHAATTKIYTLSLHDALPI